MVVIGVLTALLTPNLLSAKARSIEVSSNAYARRCLNNLANYIIENPGVTLIGLGCDSPLIKPDVKPEYIRDSSVEKDAEGNLYLNYTYRNNGQDYTSSIPINLIQ